MAAGRTAEGQLGAVGEAKELQILKKLAVQRGEGGEGG